MAGLFSGKNTFNTIIKSKNGTEFELKTFQLPWGNFWASDPTQRRNHKRHGYLDIHLDDVYVVFFSLTGRFACINYYTFCFRK